MSFTRTRIREQEGAKISDPNYSPRKKILGIREGSRNLMTLLLFVPSLSGNFLSFLPFFLSLFQLGFFAKRKPERQNFPRSGDTRIWEQGKGSFGRNWEARPPLCWQIAKTLDWTRIPARRQRRTDFKEFLLGPSLCERMSEGNTHEKYKVEETEDVFGAGSATIGHHFEIVFVSWLKVGLQVLIFENCELFAWLSDWWGSADAYRVALIWSWGVSDGCG